MHVFFVTQWFPTAERPYYGIFVLEHARAAAQNHKVTLLHIGGVRADAPRSIQVETQSIEPNLTVYHLAYRRPRLPYTTWTREMMGARQVLNTATRSSGPPDIIHANVWNTADVSLYLGKKMGIPVVLSEHSSAYARKLISPAQIRRMRFFMNRVDLILPVCDALGGYIQEYGIHRPMQSIPNVVDTGIFYPASPGEQVTSPNREITMIARLDKEKAVHMAIQAVGRLQQRGIIVHLQVAGSGPEEASLRALVSQLGLTEWVHFKGYLPKDDLAKLLRRSSAFLLTSTFENQPVVILEALMCGIPVVAPAIGGIPEVISPANGSLFRCGDLDDLVSKLTQLLTDLPKYDPQVIHQYAIQHFSLQVVGNRLSGIYQDLVKARQDHARVAAA